MKRPLLFSLCLVLLLSFSAASTAVLIGEGPVELNQGESVNITPINGTEPYEVPQTTVLGALDRAAVLGAFEYQVAEDLPPEEGNLSIFSITDVENEVVNGTPNNWTYWVNGEEGTTGPAVTDVTDGDNVTYSYGPPGHTPENASYTLFVNVSVPGGGVTPEPTGNVTPEPTGNVTPEPTGNVTPEPTGNVTPEPTGANVTIVSPEEGASVPAGNVTVSVNVTNFTLVEPTGQANVPGEGHLHYYLDAPVPTNASEPAVPETGGYVISTNLTHTWENVTAGEHNLSVQLTNNDHTPVVPLVFKTVNVTADGNVTPEPTGNVTPEPTGNVTPEPTGNVTPEPTGNVTPEPTGNVTPEPTGNVTPEPTGNVTPEPTGNVTPEPTGNVTPEPTGNVTPEPTGNVTPEPTTGAGITAEIAAGLSGEGNLTTFVGALNNSTLDQKLEQNRTYLVCAPTNDAFEGLGNQTLAAIMNNTTLLNTIIEYHVIQGDYTIEELIQLCQNSTDGQISLPTVEGTDVNVSLTDDNQLVINNIAVVTQIPITNSITVYVIDGVLIPSGAQIPPPTGNVTP
ncbi:fasciclin domain-containing protein, partial [Methanoculleus sp. UBA334]